jgi:hypothetical protein
VALLLFGLMAGTLFVGALLAALLVAFGTQIISNSSRIKEDAALGLLFACSFSLGLVLISLSCVRVNVSDYLFGNILGLGDADLWIIYVISLVALPTLVALERPLLLTMFEPAVASSQGVPVNGVKYFLIGLLVLAMISSLQAVGVILALGMLIDCTGSDDLPAFGLIGDHFLGRWNSWLCRFLRRALNLLLAKLALGSLYRSCPGGSFPARLIICPKVRNHRKITATPPSA